MLNRMKRTPFVAIFLLTLLSQPPVAGQTQSAAGSSTQTPSAGQSSTRRSVPRQLPISGRLVNADGTPRSGIVTVALALYAEQHAIDPLWGEQQVIELDANGRYTFLLGATQPDGVPAELFTSGDARWLGMTVQGESEQPRGLLLTVPYALKALDADTLGGRSAADYSLSATSLTSSSSATSAAAPGGGGGGGGGGDFSARSFIATVEDAPGFTAETRIGPPLTIRSTGLVANLNADLFDGFDSSAFPKLGTANVFTANQTINGSVTATSGSFSGLFSAVSTDGTSAVQGQFTSTSGQGFGLLGTTAGGDEPEGVATVSAGVYGRATNPNLWAFGVYGESLGTGAAIRGAGRHAVSGSGVEGIALGSSGIGGKGIAFGSSGIALEGFAPLTTGNAIAVSGRVNSATGIAGLFQNNGGGTLLVGRTSGIERFRVDGTGAVYANSYRDLAGNPIPGGDITGVAAGAGLTGGATSGDVTLALDTAFSDGRYSMLGHGHNVSEIANAATLGANSFTGTQTVQAGNLVLDASGGSTGNIVKGGGLFLHNFGSLNTFLGEGAGNLTMTGVANAGLGYTALQGNAVGSSNTAFGAATLQNNTNGANNTAAGAEALRFNTLGNSHTAMGFRALNRNTTGSNNVGVGVAVLNWNETGSNNVGVGNLALFNETGSNNVGVGLNAGLNATTGSNNIYLGANVEGVAGESNTMYLGKQGTQTKTLIAGIRGTTVAGGDMVLIDADGRLGSAPVPSTSGDISGVSVGTGLSGGGTSGDVTVALDTGFTDARYAAFAHGHDVSQVTNAASLGANTFSGTQTITTGNLTLNAAGAINKGGNIFLHNPGTQNTFVGADAGNSGTTGFGGNTAFGFQALTSLSSGDSNTAIGATALAVNSTGNSNTAVGRNALRFNTTGGGNTALGHFSMQSNTTGDSNTVSGYFSMVNNTTGSQNAVFGASSMSTNITGRSNTAVGIASLQNNNGDNNVAIGRAAGRDGTTGSYNIYLGADVLGVAGESNTIYLGRQGTQTKTTIAGIRGTTVSGGEVVLIDANGRLGSTALGSGSIGDITAVNAGPGLNGGGPSGDVTLTLNTGFTDGRYAQLTASNTFGASQTINGDLGATNVNAAGTVGAGASFTGEQFPAVILARQVAANGYAVRAQVDYEGSAVRATHRGGISLPGSDPTMPGQGIYGLSNSSNGRGVVGEAQASTGQTAGVLGTSVSPEGIGVWGQAAMFAVRGITTASGTDASIGVEGVTHTTQGIGVLGRNDSSQGGYGVKGSTIASDGIAVLGEATLGSGNIGVKGVSGSGVGYGIVGVNLDKDGVAALFNVGTEGGGAGNIIVGQSNGLNRFRVDANGLGFFNNGTQVGGADFAESVAVTEPKSLYQPGDVMIIDPALRRTMTRSTVAYSTMVAGIYSTKPGVLANPYGLDDPRMAAEVPLAIVGIVPCKVSAENGAIQPGDLLVTSSIPGHAMKGTDRARMLGAVVGKALEPLAKGTGVILVLVTLQ